MSGDEDELIRGRSALESIIGRSLDGDDWPADAMQAGARVRVVKDAAWDGPWREVFIGTIDRTLAPQPVRNRVARPGEREYSVTFDEPQFDADGDVPYRKAVVWDRYLEQQL